MTGLVITKLERHEPDGGRPFYSARVHANGSHAIAHNRYGSWQAGEREVLPSVAAALQAKLPRNERGRR